MPEPVYIHAIRPTLHQEGLEFQDFVCLQLARYHVVLQNLGSKKYQYERGENLQGFEIKLDTRCLEMGRLSIEVAEKTNRDAEFWTPSGIFRNDNSWLYIQGNYSIVYVFAKNWLRRWHDAKRPEIFESHGTVRKFYLPLSIADTCATRVLRFTD